MKERTTHRITMFIAAAGAALAVVATLLGGMEMGLGAVVGAGVAVANWLSLRWLLRRFFASADRGKNGLMLLLVAKMGALVALCWILIVRLQVDAVGFALGLTSLFVGIMLGAMGGAPDGSPADAEDGGAGAVGEEG